jgi:hypothetical protein
MQININILLREGDRQEANLGKTEIRESWGVNLGYVGWTIC